MKTLFLEKRAASAQKRLHYLDWLRVLAVLGVFYAHSLFIFDTFYWHLGDDQNSGRSVLIVLGTEWGMGLFFFLAGAGAWFTLQNSTWRHYLAERFKRLLIPFFVGFVFFSPALVFLEQISLAAYNEGLLRSYLAFFTSLFLTWNPQRLSASLFHLWFLVYLFVVSLLALPVLLFLKRKASQHFLFRLAVMCDNPLGIFLPAFPLVLIQVTLRAFSAGYESWADFFTWLFLFLYGFLLLAEPRFRTLIQKQWASLFFIALVSLFLLFYALVSGGLDRWNNLSDYSMGYVLYQVLRGMTIWSWMGFILWFGMRYLDFAADLLTSANEAVLPFYLLHYPIIFVQTFLTYTWHMNMVAKFLLVSSLALLLTIAVVELLIRRIGVLRWLFGMKARPGASSSE